MPAGRGRGTWALVGLALLVALAGCTSDDGPGAATTTTTATTTGPDAQTMRLGIGGDLIVDPVNASLASPRDLMVIDLLFDGLTRLDEEGVPQPALATRWEGTPAADGLPVPPRHGGDLRERTAGHAPGRHRLARAGHRRRATRRSPRCRSRR